MDIYNRAAELGLQTDFVDGYGRPHRTDARALADILAALPVAAEREILPINMVAAPGRQIELSLTEGTALPIRWTLRRAEQLIASETSKQPLIKPPQDLPAGVYSLEVESGSGRTEKSPYIVSPQSCFSGEFDRTWLLAVQLYGVRSDRNWGIGDFTDLEALIRLACQIGAAGLALNPLHALFDDRPHESSPYSPNSRQFLNSLYIDVAKLPGVRLGSEDQEKLRSLREATFVDYSAVAEIKNRALRSAFSAFRAQPAADLEVFRTERGKKLARFAAFEALRHSRSEPWWEWNDHAQADDAQIAELRKGPLRQEIEFVEFVQWVADRQLRACSELGEELGMSIGLYLDIAVGVQSGGFDAWEEQEAICRDLSVGAPPDSLNTAGQNWGLAGYNASGLAARGFAPFRDMLHASMRYAGAVRLDHVLGLQRLYLIPDGFPPSEGVYVQMPFESLLALTALESIANRCVVIGEDLGTVPDGFRDAMARWGIWSYRVMMFEQDYHTKKFLPPAHYPANALVTFNTHDLATYAGWHSLNDLSFKRSIGLDPGETDETRRHAHAMLDDALHENGIDKPGFNGVLEFLAQTPSRLLTVAIEDLLGVVEQPNIPGTVDEHPNWKRRLPARLEEMEQSIEAEMLRSVLAQRTDRRASRPA